MAAQIDHSPSFLSITEELGRDEIAQEEMTEDVQRVELFATPEFQPEHAHYLEVFFCFAFTKIYERLYFVRPKVNFTGVCSLRERGAGGDENELLERAARSAGASAVIFDDWPTTCDGPIRGNLKIWPYARPEPLGAASCE